MKLHINPLINKTVGMLSFELASPVNIGSGEVGIVRDFLRLPDGRLLIPASTWKGAFRRLTELIAKNTNFKDVAGLAVKLYKESQAGITYTGDKEELERFVKIFQEKLKEESVREILLDIGYSVEEIVEAQKGTKRGSLILRRAVEDFIAVHCPIGRLYGNRVLAGKIRFTDNLIKLDGEKVNIHTRPGTGIDRRSGKVKEGVLYFINTLPPGLEIKLTLIADNMVPGEPDSKLFASTLKAVSVMGVSLGARKSAGMGYMNLKDAVFYVVDLPNDKDLAIGNPFKKAGKMALEEFIKWLHG